jgi:hypothetical protein
VVGGANESAISYTSAERFDPQSETWTSAGELTSEDRFRHTMEVLPDGRVLVAAGKKSNTAFLSSAQLFDPKTNTWTATAPVGKGGNAATLSVLPSGDALFVGGFGAFTGPSVSYEYLNLAQLFDAKRNLWRQIGRLHLRRTWHTATVLKNGQVLVTGGLVDGSETNRCEVSEPCVGEECSVAESQVGSSCTTDDDCQALGPGHQCRKTTQAGHAEYPGGYCTRPCEYHTDCPNDAICGGGLPAFGEVETFCWARCEARDCRSPGYACHSVAATSTVKACWLSPLPPVDGGTPAPPGVIGKACTSSAECIPPSRGYCLTDNPTDGGPTGFKDGYCTADCEGLGNAYCGPGAACISFRGGRGQCMTTCTTPQAGQGECRDGYVCRGSKLPDGGLPAIGVCLFHCANDPVGACGQAPCKPDGYCDL